MLTFFTLFKHWEANPDLWFVSAKAHFSASKKLQFLMARPPDIGHTIWTAQNCFL